MPTSADSVPLLTKATSQWKAVNSVKEFIFMIYQACFKGKGVPQDVVHDIIDGSRPVGDAVWNHHACEDKKSNEI